MSQKLKIKCIVLEQHGITCTLQIIDKNILQIFKGKTLPEVIGRFSNKLRRQKLIPTDVVFVELMPFSEQNTKQISGLIVSIENRDLPIK